MFIISITKEGGVNMTRDKFFELKIALTEYISKYGIYYSPELLKKLQENFL